MATAAVQVPTVVAPVAVSSPKKKTTKPSTAGKSAVPAHPSTAVMVVAAIAELKEKKGSSLSAIKKYMSNNYNVDSTKLAPFIRKFLKASVVKGSLVQTNGNGAMGHFKLPVEVKKKPVAVKKPSAAKKIVKKPTIAAVSPKKRKLTAKKAAEPAAKKPKTVAAKPKKSLVKAKKVVVAPKPPKAKKAPAVKPTKAAPKKK
ncbi:histone H1A, sperm-like [Rhopalosiphum maidis]|uniref:histone H1A, sperm-like n=1 Tax=Rhopalosiphum maidis TaxID=43146 RepID=UPI000EFE7F02|nr:histone H1A, sperm-like [Rhopalosiphum maidis]